MYTFAGSTKPGSLIFLRADRLGTVDFNWRKMWKINLRFSSPYSCRNKINDAESSRTRFCKLVDANVSLIMP